MPLLHGRPACAPAGAGCRQALLSGWPGADASNDRMRPHGRAESAEAKTADETAAAGTSRELSKRDIDVARKFPDQLKTNVAESKALHNLTQHCAARCIAPTGRRA